MKTIKKAHLTWVVGFLLLLLPLATYWDTTFHDFGLRDNYANLREAHEEPGKILQFTASHGPTGLRLAVATVLCEYRRYCRTGVVAPRGGGGVWQQQLCLDCCCG